MAHAPRHRAVSARGAPRRAHLAHRAARAAQARGGRRHPAFLGGSIAGRRLQAGRIGSLTHGARRPLMLAMRTIVAVTLLLAVACKDKSASGGAASGSAASATTAGSTAAKPSAATSSAAVAKGDKLDVAALE